MVDSCHHTLLINFDFGKMILLFGAAVCYCNNLLKLIQICHSLNQFQCNRLHIKRINSNNNNSNETDASIFTKNFIKFEWTKERKNNWKRLFCHNMKLNVQCTNCISDSLSRNRFTVGMIGAFIVRQSVFDALLQNFNYKNLLMDLNANFNGNQAITKNADEIDASKQKDPLIFTLIFRWFSHFNGFPSILFRYHRHKYVIFLYLSLSLFPFYTITYSCIVRIAIKSDWYWNLVL